LLFRNLVDRVKCDPAGRRGIDRCGQLPRDLVGIVTALRSYDVTPHLESCRFCGRPSGRRSPVSPCSRYHRITRDRSAAQLFGGGAGVVCSQPALATRRPADRSALSAATHRSDEPLCRAGRGHDRTLHTATAVPQTGCARAADPARRVAITVRRRRAPERPARRALAACGGAARSRSRRLRPRD
jgi:hypothetical protein